MKSHEVTKLLRKVRESAEYEAMTGQVRAGADGYLNAFATVAANPQWSGDGLKDLLGTAQNYYVTDGDPLTGDQQRGMFAAKRLLQQ
ncbi:MAG TPA: hypothetical protein VIQ80_02105 [Candidatus Saccharimonadales bacterium]